MVTAIRLSKRNKEVWRDGILVEMFEAKPVACENNLVAWWETVGCLAEFSYTWEKDVLCPLYKKEAQHAPVNYRPVCPLFHVRKSVRSLLP